VILVDTNVLMDVFAADPKWADWSIARLDEWSRRGPLFVNPVIYAELGAAFSSVETLDAVIEEAELTFEEMPRDALFLAAKAHVLYRQRGGTRHGVLADFFVGAHAAVRRWPILTRDAARYRGYFPTVEVVTPGR
jgi:predicted nucleic acid-binding protein